MKKNLLIVGGTGYIGFNLAKKACKKNWNVFSISRYAPQKERYLKKVKYLYFDISKKENFKKKVKRNYYDFVVNCGGEVDHSSKRKVFNSHFIGCKNLVDFFQKDKKLELFLQIGSSIEYGRLKSPHKEKDWHKVSNTSSHYGNAKLKATEYLINKFKCFNFPCNILRIYLCYGPGQDLNRFIPKLITSCLKNEEFLCSTCVQYRDFIYIDDLVNLIFLILNKSQNYGEIFNAGSGTPVQLKKIVNKIRKICSGGMPQFGKLKLRKDESLKFYCDIKKTLKILKWKNKINLKNGLKKTIKYYKSEQINKHNYKLL